MYRQSVTAFIPLDKSHGFSFKTSLAYRSRSLIDRFPGMLAALLALIMALVGTEKVTIRREALRQVFQDYISAH